MTMDGRVALVAGGAGTVGSGIVHAFLRAGATVIVPSRERARLDALRSELEAAGELAGASAGASGDASGSAPSERLITIEADIALPAGAAEVRRVVERDVLGRGGQLDHLVTSLGGTWQGRPLRELDLDAFHAALHEYCGSHFVAMRALLPLMEDRAGTSYTLISGVVGEQLFDLTWGPVSVGAASLFGLSMVTRAEYAEKAVRVNELRVGMRVLRKHPVEGSPFEVSHRDVGKLVVGMAQSHVRSEVIRVGDQTELRASCGRFGVL